MQTFNFDNIQLFLATCDAKQLVSIQGTIQTLLSEKLDQLDLNIKVERSEVEPELFIPQQFEDEGEEDSKSWGDIMDEMDLDQSEAPISLVQIIEEDDFEEELTQVEENKLNFLSKSDTTDRTCVVVRGLFAGISDMDAARQKIIPLISKIEGKKGRVKRLFLVAYDGDYSGTTFFYCYDQKQAVRVFKFFGTCEDFQVDWRMKRKE